MFSGKQTTSREHLNQSKKSFKEETTVFLLIILLVLNFQFFVLIPCYSSEFFTCLAMSFFNCSDDKNFKIKTYFQA